MPEKSWDAQLMGYLKKAGDDLKRTGEEFRGEAQRLLREVQKPENQARVKENLRELGVWAKKTASEVAVQVDAAVKRAESKLEATISGGAGGAGDEQRSAPTQRATPVTPPVRETSSEADPAPSRPRKTASKTVGKKPGARAKPAAKGAAKKPLGRKKS
jgi:hypothetical protein